MRSIARIMEQAANGIRRQRTVTAPTAATAAYTGVSRDRWGWCRDFERGPGSGRCWVWWHAADREFPNAEHVVQNPFGILDQSVVGTNDGSARAARCSATSALVRRSYMPGSTKLPAETA
jgi:hypothetical protein